MKLKTCGGKKRKNKRETLEPNPEAFIQENSEREEEKKKMKMNTLKCHLHSKHRTLLPSDGSFSPSMLVWIEISGAYV